MGLPLNEFSSTPAPAAFMAPDSRLRLDLLVDYELGGVDLFDASQGLMVQVWEARVSGGVVQVKPESAGTWTDVLTDSGITEIALAFDQNMRPVVAYVAGGVAKMRWFDTVPAAFVTTTFTGASSPVVTMDDKRALQMITNDVLLFYIKAGSVYCRQQRDRFSVERLLGAVPAGSTRFKRWGMSEALRVQLEFGTDETLSVDPDAVIHTEAYTDLLTDKLYVVDATSIVPMFDAANRTGVWRSPMLLAHQYPAFNWVRVNGQMDGAVVVRLYGDGALWHTTEPISDRAAHRLPKGRFKTIEIQVESAGDVTSVVMVSNTAELVVQLKGP